jgi:chromosome segregation ATPase
MAQVEDLVNRFSEAEAALRRLLDSAHQLSSAREELSGARQDMSRTQADSLDRLEEARRTIREQLEAADEQALGRLEATIAAVERRLEETDKTGLERIGVAERSLEASQKALADVASGIYALTSELKDIARDLKDSAIALRSLDPERIDTRLAALATAAQDAAEQRARQQVLLIVVAVLVVVLGVAALAL